MRSNGWLMPWPISVFQRVGDSAVGTLDLVGVTLFIPPTLFIETIKVGSKTFAVPLG